MRIALIGRVASGKDFLAAKLVEFGFVRLSFSDPIHRFVEEYILRRPYNKAEPNIRRILQTVGAAGRGDIPTPDWLETAVKELNIRDWGDSDFWIKRLNVELMKLDKTSCVAISDCRHDNEVAFVKDNQFILFAVLCSEATRKRRLATRGEQFDPVTEAHISERLARNFESVVSPENVIWNDSVAVPDLRYMQYSDFIDWVIQKLTEESSKLQD